jgi:hypothetical protein
MIGCAFVGLRVRVLPQLPRGVMHSPLIQTARLVPKPGIRIATVLGAMDDSYDLCLLVHA